MWPWTWALGLIFLFVGALAIGWSSDSVGTAVFRLMGLNLLFLILCEVTGVK